MNSARSGGSVLRLLLYKANLSAPTWRAFRRPASAPAAMATIVGQVVWRRRFNAVFHFFDLLRTAGHDGAGHDGAGHDDGGGHDGGERDGGGHDGGGHDGGGHGVGGASARVRLLVSSGHMPKELAKEAGKAVRCGDVVRVTCDLDAEKQLWRVTALQVLS